MPNLSLLLLTHNSSKELRQNFSWLDSCPPINEIVVVDDNSSDDTEKLAKSLASKKRTVKFFSRGLANDFSAQRQFGVDHSTNDLILWLDPDETPSDIFLDFINNIDKHKYENVAFKRHDIFLGHPLNHGETAAGFFLRLFNKKSGHFVGTVHEVWQTSLPVLQSPAFIVHTSHPNLKTFFSKLDFYSTIRAQELKSQHIKPSLFSIIFYPKAKFIQNYIFRLGFLDGTPGIILALGMSFHSFLVRAKLWQLSKN